MYLSILIYTEDTRHNYIYYSNVMLHMSELTCCIFRLSNVIYMYNLYVTYNVQFVCDNVQFVCDYVQFVTYNVQFVCDNEQFVCDL